MNAPNHPQNHDMLALVADHLAPLHPTFLDIIDDSANHGGYRGITTHIHINLVSADFSQLRTLARHQLVYQHIAPLLTQNGGTLHAVGISAYAPDEPRTPANIPNCAHP